MPALELHLNRMLQLRFKSHWNAPNVAIPITLELNWNAGYLGKRYEWQKSVIAFPPLSLTAKRLTA